MTNTILMTATSAEQTLLAGEIDGVRHRVGGRPWHSGRLRGRDVHLIEGGMGAVNTAQALTCALQADLPDLVLQVGVGGGYPHTSLRIGDVALASEEVYGDLGVRTGAGWQPCELIGIPVWRDGKGEIFNRFELDAELVSHARAAVAAEAEEPAVGAFVTVQECSGSAELGRERGLRFEALCENMEGAAAAHVCAIYGVPFLEIRGISNRVEDRDIGSWDIPLAATAAQSAALLVLEKLEL